MTDSAIDRAILQSVADFIIHVDRDARILYINKVEGGYKMEDVIGLTAYDFMPPEYHEVFHQAIQHALDEGETSRFETRAQKTPASETGDGWFLNRVMPVHSSEPPPTALIISTEITERKAMESTLRESGERFRALIEGSLDIITVLRPDATIGFISPSIEDLLGYRPSQLMGQSVFEIVHEKDRPALREVFDELLEEPGMTRQLQLQVRHHNGSWHILEAFGRSLFHLPSVGGMIVNARDVTERLFLEEQLLQAQKMESVGRLAGGIAHDFNNLLTAIDGYAQLAQRQIALSRDANGSLEQISQAVKRAARLTSQLLAFARKQISEPKTVRIEDLVRETRSLLKRLIGEDITLETTFQPELWPVRIDPGHFEQVLVNLVVNARDAMSDGGRLLIEVGTVTLAEAEADRIWDLLPGDYLRVTVSDSGCGIDPALAKNIFEPFFTTKETGKGTGLGLATCHGIIRQAGGNIRVSTRLEFRTTFEILLPRSAEQVETALTRSGSSVQGGNETVLIVEDEAMVLHVTTVALQAQGYEVLAADSGTAALALASENEAPIDLLMTDVIMPGMNGRRLSELLKESRPNLKILFTSGYTDDLIVQHGVLDPDVEFLEKPYTLTELLCRVREVLDS